MTPNFICPCCGLHVHYSDATAQTILETVARHYGITVHDLTWGNYSYRSASARSRSVAIYLLRVLTGAKFKDFSPLFHWQDRGSYAGARFAALLVQLEAEEDFAEEVNHITQKVIRALKIPVFQKKIA
jgi:chromosomal replication initiation ATPase DnaA